MHSINIAYTLKIMTIEKNLTVEKIKIPCHKDHRGSLAFVENTELQKAIPFRFERVFWVYNIPQHAERGGHAHKTCSEFFVAASGSCDMELHDGKHMVQLHLDNPDEGIVIAPMVWCRYYNCSPDFLGLCLASHAYTTEGYIYDFENFLREINS